LSANYYGGHEQPLPRSSLNRRALEDASIGGLTPSSAGHGLARNETLDSIVDDSTQIHNDVGGNPMKRIELENLNQHRSLNTSLAHQQNSVFLSNQKHVNSQQLHAYESAGRGEPRARSYLGGGPPAGMTQTPSYDALNQHMLPQVSHRSGSLQHGGLNAQHSQVSRGGSVSLSQLHSYNQNVLRQAQASQFLSTNIAVEVLNKPLQKKAHLANAQSLRPYINPNSEYFQSKQYGNLLSWEDKAGAAR